MSQINLTERQRQILALLVQGKCNKEIARKLGIAHGTVKIHLNHIYDRIGIRSRTKIIVKYMKELQ